MRPARPGHYESDLAGLQRFRRRVVQDEGQPLDWRRDMVKRVDVLIERVNEVVSKQLLSAKKPSRKRRKPTTEAAAESG